MKKLSMDIMECPGAWYGNQPENNDGVGNLVIDVCEVERALAWLRPRFDYKAIDVMIMPDSRGIIFSLLVKGWVSRPEVFEGKEACEG